MNVFESVRNLTRMLLLSVVFLFGFPIYTAANNLVISGDAFLNYSSYMFEIPPERHTIPINLRLTHETGYCAYEYKDNRAIVQVYPYRETGSSPRQKIPDQIRKKLSDQSPGGGWQSYSKLTPQSPFSSRTYLFTPSQNVYQVFHFIDIPPKHVVLFLLSVNGDGSKEILPYLDDFNTMISTFQWTLPQE